MKVENQYKDFVSYIIQNNFKRDLTLIDKQRTFTNLLTDFTNNYGLNSDDISIEGFKDFLLFIGAKQTDENFDTFIGVTTLDSDEAVTFKTNIPITDRSIEENNITLYTNVMLQEKLTKVMAFYISTINSSEYVILEAKDVKDDYHMHFITHTSQYDDRLWLQGYSLYKFENKPDEIRVNYRLVCNDTHEVINVEDVVHEVLTNNCKEYKEKYPIFIPELKDDMENVYIPQDDSEEEKKKYLESINIGGALPDRPVYILAPITGNIIEVFLDIPESEEAGTYLIDIINKNIVKKIRPEHKILNYHKEFMVIMDTDGDIIFSPYDTLLEESPKITPEQNAKFDAFSNIDGSGIYYGVTQHEPDPEDPEDSGHFDVTLYELAYDVANKKYVIQTNTFTTFQFPNKLVLSKEASRLTLIYVSDGYIHSTAYFLMEGKVYSYTTMLLEGMSTAMEARLPELLGHVQATNYHDLEGDTWYYIHKFVNITSEKRKQDISDALLADFKKQYGDDGTPVNDEYMTVRGQVLVNITDQTAIDQESLSLNMSYSGRFVFINKGDGTKKVGKYYLTNNVIDKEKMSELILRGQGEVKKEKDIL